LVHTEFEGNVIGEVWRAEEAAKEIIYFKAQGEQKWFRIEYTGPLMLERANFMANKLKNLAATGSGVEVGVDYDNLTVGDPPHTPTTSYNLVRYIQVKA